MDERGIWAIIVACSVNDGIFVQNEYVRRDYVLYRVPLSLVFVIVVDLSSFIHLFVCQGPPGERGQRGVQGIPGVKVNNVKEKKRKSSNNILINAFNQTVDDDDYDDHDDRDLANHDYCSCFMDHIIIVFVLFCCCYNCR